MRSYAVTEVRDAKTGGVVASSDSFGAHGAESDQCTDTRHKFYGAYWHKFEPYVVRAVAPSRT